YYLIQTAPEPHRRAFLKPFLRLDSAEFCASCHKVHLDVPVNQYRWVRGFNEYDNWQASGISGEGARSFYYPEKSSTCVDCHMPLVRSRDAGNHAGFVHSHRFPAANTAVAYVNHDEKQLQAEEDFLKEGPPGPGGALSVDIFAASPEEAQPGQPQMRRRAGEVPIAASTFAVGEEAEGAAGPVLLREVGRVAAPLDRAAPALQPGDTVKVDVVVRTRKVGHFFPGGTVDAFDVWVELKGEDETGRVVFWSGQVKDSGRGPVEPGAHFYRSYQLDEHGHMINKRNAWQTRSVLYVRLIPPGAADVAHYRVRIPRDAKGAIRLTAKLNYRKFSYYYTQFAYAGRPGTGEVTPAFDDRPFLFRASDVPANVSGEIKGRIPELPIVTLASAETVLRVGARGAATEWQPAVRREDRVRWNDWGIGLLLQGDLKGAEYAFQKVTEADPGYADGWLNAARAYIQEGETDAAKPYLAKALAINPRLARAHYFQALVEKADGDYDAALRSLQFAEQQYPRDRVVLNQIARILFLERRYREALAVLDRVCRVDPEDVAMHYTRMLCHRGLGELEAAGREEKLFRRFKADEASEAITERARMASPEDNNERQPIHEHDSVRLAKEAPNKALRSAAAQEAGGPDAVLAANAAAGGALRPAAAQGASEARTARARREQFDPPPATDGAGGGDR
ncbi:MAG TPA: tetratricopeptide repeat protein, partial [Bryobacterales bacterium]|nr:tetratricopeptide repeat protein [Bryobacterales bacterium]